MSDKSDLLQALTELGEIFEEHENTRAKQNEDWWNSLSEEEREDAFYAVVKRLHKGELKDTGSYRHVLYSVFGFGLHMYGEGMSCGYLDLHNSIYSQQEIDNLKQTSYQSGYSEAIENMLELLDNALANGYRQHEYQELVDQLTILKEEH